MFFLLLAAFTVVINGRPEDSFGYPPRPSTGYSPNSKSLPSFRPPGLGGFTPNAFPHSAFHTVFEQPIVQKHIYLHVPPPDYEELHPRPIQVPINPPQKHYKIIFIKVPSPAAPAIPVIPVQPQNEEKTLVYVLVKKPEEQQKIIAPTVAQTRPSKPEVYFIRYKAHKRSGDSGGHAVYRSPEPSSQYGPPRHFEHF